MTYLVATVMFLAFGCASPEPVDEPAPMNEAVSQDIDSPMKLVASMTKYNVGVIWKGENWDEDSPGVIDARIQETRESWKKSIADGKLVGAVRVVDPDELWGLLFFKTESLEEMEAIADQALPVAEGILDGTVMPVWGTKGMGAGLADALKDDPDAELEREKHYMVIYRKGENWSDDAYAPETREASSESIEYLYGLYKSGDLAYSAALEDFSRDARGVAILSVDSAEEAMELASQDPKVVKKWLTVEVKEVFIVGGVLP